MNLQESIRRILREGGFVPLPIRRRISTDDLEEAFAYSLETNATHMDNPNTVLYKEKKPSLWVFSKFVIDDMITLIEQEYFTNDNRIYFSDTEEDDKTYHEKIRQPLLRHYGKRIKEKYDEVMSSNDEEIIQESIRRTLKENNTEKILRVIDNYIKENYPKFNETDANYEDYESDDGHIIVTYHNPDGGQFFAIYRDKRNELELNRDIYNDLYMTFDYNIKYVIDWFNFEFGENAKYLVKPDKYEDDEDDDYFNYLMNQNLQESIRRTLREVRVPRSERVELYKDDNIIVVVPLTHRALQKYAHLCQWCINSDLDEWEEYHKGKHAVIIQRNPKKPKIGITGFPTASEILMLQRWGEGYTFNDIQDILGYEFDDEQEADKYLSSLTKDINNFATNIVYYSPENGIYDMEDNQMIWYNVTDIPNVTPEVRKIMYDYLQENEEMSIQESIRRILREETNQKNEGLFNLINDLGLYGFMEDMGLNYSEIVFKIGELPREIKIQYIKDVVSNFEQLPYEFDLSNTIGSIPLFIDEDDNNVYVESIYNRDNKLKLHTYITTEDGYDDYIAIYEDDLDYETLDTLVAELSEKLQHERN